MSAGRGHAGRSVSDGGRSGRRRWRRAGYRRSVRWFRRATPGQRLPMAAVTDLGFANYARLAGAPAPRRRVLDRAARARRLERVPRVTTDRRARRGWVRGSRRGRHLRGRGPRRLPAGAAARRGLDAGRVLAAASAAWSCSRRGPPKMAFFRPYRRWAFESAALDLALRQRGQSLGAALGRPYRPVRFASPRASTSRPGSRSHPELEFKLDPTPEWDAVLAGARRRLRARARPRLQGLLRGLRRREPARPVQYAMPSPGASPTRSSRTRHSRGRREPRSTASEGRFSFDAPIHSWTDVEEIAVRVFGSMEPLSATSTSSRRVSARWRAALLRRARPGRRDGALRRRPVRARCRPRPDRGAGQPVLPRTAPTTWRRASITAKPGPACRAARWSRSSRAPGFGFVFRR